MSQSENVDTHLESSLCEFGTRLPVFPNNGEQGVRILAKKLLVEPVEDLVYTAGLRVKSNSLSYPSPFPFSTSFSKFT